VVKQWIQSWDPLLQKYGFNCYTFVWLSLLVSRDCCICGSCQPLQANAGLCVKLLHEHFIPRLAKHNSVMMLLRRAILRFEPFKTFKPSPSHCATGDQSAGLVFLPSLVWDSSLDLKCKSD
jgi:hypothetical protein